MADFVEETVETYLDRYAKATSCTVTDLRPEHLKLWRLKQLHLYSVITRRVLAAIDTKLDYRQAQPGKLKALIAHVSRMAFPMFVAGMAGNPIHHNMQVAENMVSIVAHGPKRQHAYLRKALMLALLHDVGNGFVDPGLRKIKISDIKDTIARMKRENKSKREIDAKVKALGKEGEQYRDAHMKEGARVAVDFLKHVYKALKVRHARGELEHIEKCIRIHDNPSIAEFRSQRKEPFGKKDLIPLDDGLAYALREADRLWMISREGLEKDLFDDLSKNENRNKRKKKKPDALGKLKHNVGRFREEYGLYCRVKGITRTQMKGFKDQTLFRTVGGFKLYRRHLECRLCELFGNNYDPRILQEILRGRCHNNGVKRT